MEIDLILGTIFLTCTYDIPAQTKIPPQGPRSSKETLTMLIVDLSEFWYESPIKLAKL